MAKTWHAILILQQYKHPDRINRITQNKPFSEDSIDKLEERWTNWDCFPCRVATVTNIFTTEDD